MSFLMNFSNLRRSIRLIDEKNCNSVIESPLGYFNKIPVEIKFIIFKYIPVIGLSNLALTSKAIRNIVELYRRSETSQKHLFSHPLDHSIQFKANMSDCIEEFKEYGLLFKRTTCLYPTRDRLKLLNMFLIKHHCAFFSKCDIENCINMKCCGIFIHTVIAGWEDKELVKVFQSITANAMIIKNVDTICKFKPGTFCLLEIYTRLFYRRIFIDSADTLYEKAFWLNLIIKDLPIVLQARIIYLLFGPHKNGHILWNEFEDSAPWSKEQSLTYFSELAGAIRLLAFYNKEINQNGCIISIIEELIKTPEAWLADNVSNLLFLCGDMITIKVLRSKAINGRMYEIANIIAFIIVASFRHEMNTKFSLNIIKQMCLSIESSKERFNFIENITEIFREIISDLQDFSNTDDDNREFEHLTNALLCFVKDMMHLIYSDALYKSF